MALSFSRIFLRKSALFILIIALLLFFSFPLNLAMAQSTFGGRVLFSLPCANGGLLLTIGPPNGGVFLYQLGISTLYREYQARIGPWVLGNYTIGGICMAGIPPFVFPVFTQGTIRQMGTSF